MAIYRIYNIIWDVGVKRPVYKGGPTRAYFTKCLNYELPLPNQIISVSGETDSDARKRLEEKYDCKMKQYCVESEMTKISDTVHLTKPRPWKIATVREWFSEDEKIQKMSDEVLDGIIQFASMCQYAPTEEFRQFIRKWDVYENYLDAVKDILCCVPPDDMSDLVDKFDLARQILIWKGVRFFTTEEHEVAVYNPE